VNQSPKFEIKNLKKTLKDITISDDLIVSEKPKFDFHICKICYSLVREPISCNDCDEIFCLFCIEESKKLSSKCPICRKVFKERKINKFNKSIIEDLVISCPFECKEIIKYGLFLKHLELCLNIPKIYKCSLCYENISIENNNLEKISNHEQNCEKIKLTCRNCGKCFMQNYYNEHKFICEKRINKCNRCERFVLEKCKYDHLENDCKLYCELVLLLKNILYKI